MKQGQIEREIGQVVQRILPLTRKHPSIGKKEFEEIHAEIIKYLHENTKKGIGLITQKTNRVLRNLPNEYGALPEEQRSWEALIGYLYVKYLKELGKLAYQGVGLTELPPRLLWFDGMKGTRE